MWTGLSRTYPIGCAIFRRIRRIGARSFDACHEDAAIKHVYDVVIGLSRYVAIVYVSGRSDCIREATFAWLSRHGLCRGRSMRKDGDRRADHLVKRELLE
jgi:hypothetical protein